MKSREFGEPRGWKPAKIRILKNGNQPSRLSRSASNKRKISDLATGPSCLFQPSSPVVAVSVHAASAGSIGGVSEFIASRSSRLLRNVF